MLDLPLSRLQQARDQALARRREDRELWLQAMEVSVASIMQTTLIAGGAKPARAADAASGFRLLARPAPLPSMAAVAMRMGGLGQLVGPDELAGADPEQVAAEVARLRELVSDG